MGWGRQKHESIIIFKKPIFDKSPALFSLLCAGLLIFGVASFVCFRQFETVRNNSLNADKTAASLVATVLAGREEPGGVLNSYAQRPLLVKAVAEKDLAAIHYNLEEMKRNNPAIDLTFLTDKDGTIWANSPYSRKQSVRTYPVGIGIKALAPVGSPTHPPSFSSLLPTNLLPLRLLHPSWTKKEGHRNSWKFTSPRLYSRNHSIYIFESRCGSECYRSKGTTAFQQQIPIPR